MTIQGPDGRVRCRWSAGAPGFVTYHDDEWGRPTGDDRLLFEKICLETFQSGLSWRTILDKRESFRRAFCGFDIHKVAAFTEADVERLLQDASIVRHRGKIEAVIHNARRAQELDSLAALLWSFEPEEQTLGPPQTLSKSPASAALSKELKRRGWKWVGPTTAYSLMQAMGLINDHAEDCFVREHIHRARGAFSRPQ